MLYRVSEFHSFLMYALIFFNMEKTAVSTPPPYNFNKASSHIDFYGHLINMDNLEILKSLEESVELRNRNALI